jgi:Dockerin type I domain
MISLFTKRFGMLLICSISFLTILYSQSGDTTPPTFTKTPNATLSSVAKECKTSVKIVACEATDAGGIAQYGFQLIRLKDQTTVLANNTFPAEITIADADFGNYTLRYSATDNNGNKATKDIAVVIKDIAKPVPICFTGLSVDLFAPLGKILVKATAFDAGSYDNCQSQLDFFIQTPSPGWDAKIADFVIDSSATSVTSAQTPKKIAKLVEFSCIGAQTVALWVKDKAGNWDYCETYIDVQNNFNIPNVPKCPSAIDTSGLYFTVLLTKENGDPAVGSPIINNSFAVGGFNPTKFSQGIAKFLLPKDSIFQLGVSNNSNPTNGVSTLDLVLIVKHILGQQLIQSKYRLKAADVNKNSTITTSDLVELRKIILGILPNFQTNESWQFFYDTTLNNTVTINSKKKKSAKFVGVKTGDINDSAVQSAPRGEQATLFFEANEQNFEAGEEVVFGYKMPNVDAYQSSIFYDEKTLQLIDIQGNKDNFYLKKNGAITVSELLIGEQKMPSSLRFRALQKGKLSEHIRLSSELISSEAYQNDVVFDLKLRFNQSSESAFELFQNQPNPFDAQTKITFSSPSQNTATLKIYDLNGRTMYQTELSCEKGYNEFLLEKINLSKGLYRYELAIDGVAKSKNMLKL